jgi:hypothetical protein
LEKKENKIKYETLVETLRPMSSAAVNTRIGLKETPLAQEQALVAPIWPTGDLAHHRCANPVPGFSYTTNLTRFISLANRMVDVGKIPKVCLVYA